MIKWKKIYFDLDNTLYSHEFAFEKAIQDCYQDMIEEWEEKGINIPSVPLEDWFDVFKYFSDEYWDEYEQKKVTQVAYRRKRYIATMAHFHFPCDQRDADRFHENYYEKAQHYVQPYPGLATLLQFLKERRLEIGVITNGKTKVQWQKYRKLKLYRWIEQKHFIVSEEVGVEKPSPEIFQYALSQTPPDKALFIGDTWSHDIVGAIESGWDAIYLNTQKRAPTTTHQPFMQCQRLTELLSYFQMKILGKHDT